MDKIKIIEIAILAFAAFTPTIIAFFAAQVKFQREIDKANHKAELLNQRIDNLQEYIEEIFTRIENDIKYIKEHGKN